LLFSIALFHCFFLFLRKPFIRGVFSSIPQGVSSSLWESKAKHNLTPHPLLDHTFVQKVMAVFLLNSLQFWQPRFEIDPHTVYGLHVHKQRSMNVIASPHPTPTPPHA